MPNFYDLPPRPCISGIEHVRKVNRLLWEKGLRFQIDEDEEDNFAVDLQEKYEGGFLLVGLSGLPINWSKLMNDILKYQLFIITMGSLDGLILVEDKLFAISVRDFCFVIDLKTVKFAKPNAAPRDK